MSKTPILQGDSTEPCRIGVLLCQVLNVGRSCYALCRSRSPVAAVNIFMLKAMVIVVSANRLTVSMLRNAPFELSRCAVSLPETARFAMQDALFRNTERFVSENEVCRAFFSCIFACIGECRHSLLFGVGKTTVPPG